MADNYYKNMDNLPSSSSKRRQSSCTLWLIVCIGHSLIGVFVFGYNISLFNIPEEIIRSTAAKSYITDVLWEVVNAMFPVGALFGAAFSGKLADKYGRKRMIMVDSMLNIIASVITATSFYYSQLLIGRFISGIGSGMATVVCSAYLNEISPEHLRGTIGTLLQLMITIAIVISELLGKLWSNDPLWRYGCALGGCLCIFQLCLGSFTLLESPKYLLAQDNAIPKKKAMEILQKLQGRNYNSESDEYPMIEAKSSNILSSEHSEQQNSKKDESLWNGIMQYAVIKRIFFVSLCLHILQQLSGINVVFYYSTNILQSAGFNNTWLGSVLLSTANFLAVVIVTPLVDRLGRRLLLLISAIGMVVSSVAVTITFVGLDGAKDDDTDEWGIAMIVCMIGYVMFFEFGLGPIPWLIVAEMTPIEYRGAMVSASQVVNYLCNTIIAASSVTLLNALGVYGFVPFGVVCAIGALFIFVYVPETKQKTTKQIVDALDATYYADKEDERIGKNVHDSFL